MKTVLTAMNRPVYETLVYQFTATQSILDYQNVARECGQFSVAYPFPVIRMQKAMLLKN